MIIYKAKNIVNGKIYIGQTINTLNHRKLGHLHHANNNSDTYFARAIRKYGIDNFKWQVVCICPNLDVLNEQEQYYISFYGSMNNGYNLTSGGLNCEPSEETKKKISESLKGKAKSKDHRKKISISRKGARFSEEHLKNLSIAHQGRTKEHCKKISIAAKKRLANKENNSFYGKKHSEETRKKMSVSAKNRKIKPKGK